jgi:hypothetical protein
MEKPETFSVELTHQEINNLMVAMNMLVKASSDTELDRNIGARAQVQTKFMEAMKPKE